MKTPKTSLSHLTASPASLLTASPAVSPSQETCEARNAPTALGSPYASWPTLRAEYGRIYQPPQYKPGTWHWHRLTIDRLASVCPTPADLSAGALAELTRRLRDEGLADHSINGNLRSARKIARDLVRHRVLAINPFEDARLMIPRPRRSRSMAVPTAAQVAGLLARADEEARQAKGPRQAFSAHRLRALATVLAYVGVRAGEVLHLRWRDVDLDERIVTITRDEASGYDVKTSASEQRLPIPRRAAEILGEWKTIQAQLTGSVRTYVISTWLVDKPWTTGRPGHRPFEQMKALGERCGLEGIHLKAWRHIWNTLAKARFGLSAEQVRSVLRHTTTETQEWYTHDQLEELRGVVERVDYTA